MKRFSVIATFLIVLALISCNKDKSEETEIRSFTSPLGKVLHYPTPSEELQKKYEEALVNYNAAPENAENIIWLGRRTAYLGRYQEAIDVYSKGIELYPDNPRFYRHRGHRYISVREFDKAIQDLEKAAALIKNSPNEVEQDGMPNKLNIPVSTLHGNIYYHLGLAYYLIHQYPKAYEAYINCRNSGSNNDNIVSSTHWLYMIQRRMGNFDLALEMLEPISDGKNIIENADYYSLCRFYKGLIPIDSIAIEGDSPSSDALKYGIANWYLYNADTVKAIEEFDNILEGNSWTSFGYIAAESDILEYFKH